ncbi:MAG: hypothetical protein IPK71_05310 [Myxococcales bacterium]|nr:hypothetical protein [Myxococcales bacterium]
MKRAHAVYAAVLVAVAPAVARAEPIATPRLEGGRRAEVEATVVTSVWSAASSVRAFHESTQLVGRLRVLDPVELGVAFAVSHTRFSSDTEPPRSATRPSNPVLWALVRLHANDRVRVHTGAFLGAPLVLAASGLPESPTARFGDRMARAARGYDTPWLFADSAIPMGLTLSATVKPLPYVVVGGVVQPGVLLSVNRNASRLAVVASTHVALLTGSVRVGARATLGAESVPIEGHDFAQLAIAPFVGLERERLSLSLSTNVGVAGPYRVGNDVATAWGAALSLALGL